MNDPVPVITDPLIELQNVTKVYPMGDSFVHALRGVDLTIRHGEFVSITGPSGSGKSTLLHIIGCLDTPTEGTYRLEGVPVSELSDEQLSETRNRRIGFVFQNFNLMTRYTALKNVELPLVYSAFDGNRRQKAMAALEAVHLSTRSGHRPNELSGGERQRVAIARAMVNDPAMILADEPSGNLDTAVGKDIVRMLIEMNEQKHITLLVVTHDRELAALAPRTVEIRDGKVTEDIRRTR